MYTIKELKKIITKKNKPYLESGPQKLYIEVCGNNIIKLRNKPISWINLHSLIYEGDYTLVVGRKNISHNPGWGGRRLPGPGKKIGRPAKDDKKKPVSFTIRNDINKSISDLAKKHSISKSSIVQMAIKHLLKDSHIE